MRNRVVIIVQNLPVPFDRRVWLECKALVAAGYEVSVVCPQGPGDPKYHEVDGVRLYKYPAPPAANGVRGYAREFAVCWLRTARLLQRVWKDGGFDAIQACNPPDTYALLALRYRKRGVRFVYDQHDLCPEVYQSRFGHPSRLLLRGLFLLEWLTYRTAHHVISTNESYRDVARRRGGLRLEDTTVVRSGPDTDRMRPGQPHPELRRGRRHLACYLGVMGPQDGVDNVLRMLDVLVHERGREDLHVALLGFGDCYEGLRELCTDLGLDDFVTFTGRADLALIDRYLSTADVGISPDPLSPLNDVSTMNKTMEYMAYGLPVVAYDLKETRVSAGDAGTYVRPADTAGFATAVTDLLDDPDRRRALGGAARRRAVEVLDWRRQAVAYVGVFDRLLRGRPNRRAAGGLPVQRSEALVEASKASIGSRS